MTVTEAARLLEIDPQTVRYWIKRGNLLTARHVKDIPKSRYRIQKEDFLTFVEKQLEMTGDDLERMRVRVEELQGTQRRKATAASAEEQQSV